MFYPSANDVNCPMKRIFMLVTPRNIYANVQSEDKPYKCHWDVNNLGNAYVLLLR